jgi:glycine cleavage system aminomethyltransferase T/glycine/D-amino acid oxidase-like deaminating enzyme
MKSHARAIVIGGGIAGCSVLYHLAKLGWNDVALLERNELTSGSTWHSVGNTPMFTASLNILRVLKYSNELYASLEAETGQNVGYHQVGSLRLATTRDYLKWYEQIQDMAQLAGVRNEIISIEQARELNPFINPDGVLAVAHLHGDGYLDPASVTFALAKGARQRGAEIYRGTRVEKISRTASGEWDIATNNGNITAEIVVNAGGQWAREIGHLVGVELPLVPMEHQYVITEAIPEIAAMNSIAFPAMTKREIPVTRDPERVFYMRQEGDGLLFGFFENNPIPWAVNGIPRDFGQQLLPNRVEHLEPDLLRAVERIPILGQTGIKKIVNGPDAYTPDGAPIVGPVPNARNFFVIAGFSLFGIANSGGTGRACAEWIVNGAPEIDMWEYDVRRFGEYASRKTYLVAKAVEAYAMDYAVHYPYHERDAGRPLKTSPLHDLLQAQGAVFSARHGWERPAWFAPHGVEPRDEHTFARPNWFEHVGAECRGVRERVGVLDQTSFGKFEISGEGALEWLNRMCANEIDVAIGKIVVTQMLNERGGIECDVTVTRVAENTFWVITAAWTTTHDGGWIEMHLPQDGSVTLRDISEEYAVLSLMGPRARDVLSRLTDADISNHGFRFMHAQDIFVGAAPVRAYRVSYVGELGWELYMPSAYQRYVYQLLMEAGREDGIVNFGYRALDSMRMEKGYRFWGLDMNPLTTPLEAGLSQFVKLNKRSEFIGRAALLEQKAKGVAHTLECLVVENTDAIPHGWEPIFAENDAVSYVCSGEYGHYTGKTLAFAYLPPPRNAPGASLSIKLFGEHFPATVVRAPLYDPANVKLKA